MRLRGLSPFKYTISIQTPCCWCFKLRWLWLPHGPLRPLRGSGFALGRPGACGAGAFPLRSFAQDNHAYNSIVASFYIWGHIPQTPCGEAADIKQGQYDRVRRMSNAKHSPFCGAGQPSEARQPKAARAPRIGVYYLANETIRSRRGMGRLFVRGSGAPPAAESHASRRSEPKDSPPLQPAPETPRLRTCASSSTGTTPSDSGNCTRGRRRLRHTDREGFFSKSGDSPHARTLGTVPHASMGTDPIQIACVYPRHSSRYSTIRFAA